MKKNLLKKLSAFIVLATMFSVNTIAQEQQSTLSPTLQSPSLAITPHCLCNVKGWGCGGLNPGCALYCGSYCRHHDLISNGESKSTSIAFYIEETGNVSLKLYDTTGRLITTLVDNSFEQGEHTISWNSKDENGYTVNPGIYSLRMNTGGSSESEKLIVMN